MAAVTATVAQTALLYVGRQTYLGLAADATYGTAYLTTQWTNVYPLNSFDGPKVAIYRNGGIVKEQGIGTVKQWRDVRFRVDLFGRNFGEAEQMLATLFSAWEVDFDCTPANLITPTVGQGYLRIAGGIKYMAFSEPRTMADERSSQSFFRRIQDVTVTIGD